MEPAYISRYSDGLRAGRSGFDFRQEKKISLISTSRTALGPIQPPIQWVRGVKRTEREADHSPPSSAEVKNGGAILPLLHVFMA
jgi:hypothetical protein